MGINQMGSILQKNKYLKPISVAFSTVYFILVYSICNYFYPESDPMSVKGWWNLKCDSYLLLVLIWIVISSMRKTTDKNLVTFQKIMTAISIGFGLSNYIDRRFIQDREFGLNDLGIVIVIILISQINLPKIKRRALKNLTR